MGPLKKGAQQKFQQLAVCLMSSKHDRRLAESGSTIVNKSALDPESKAAAAAAAESFEI